MDFPLYFLLGCHLSGLELAVFSHWLNVDENLINPSYYIKKALLNFVYLCLGKKCHVRRYSSLILNR